MRELLQIVCKRKDGEPFRVGSHAALPLMDIRLKRGCTACEACFRVCPTGAMQIREDDASWNLVFAIDRCVGCGVCGEVAHAAILCPSFYRADVISNPTVWDRFKHRLRAVVIGWLAGRPREAAA